MRWLSSWKKPWWSRALTPNSPRPRFRLEHLEARVVPAPVPTITGLAATQNILLGESVNYSFNFSNASATDAGFSPYLEVAVDTSGPDGAASAPLDGVGAPAVTAAGLPLSPVGAVPTLTAGQATYTNPFTGQ